MLSSVPQPAPRSLVSAKACIVIGGGLLWLLACGWSTVALMPLGEEREGFGMGIVMLVVVVGPLATLLLSVGMLLAWYRVYHDARVKTRTNVTVLTFGALTLVGVALCAGRILFIH
jgi:hypothetical protein